VRDTVRAIDELIRVARPGGKVAILEFSRPRGRLLGRLYLAFFRYLLPRIGQALAPNDDRAYQYLPQSVLEFPDGQAMLDLLAARGLTGLRQYPLTHGIATLYVGIKLGSSGSSGSKEPVP
jgi:demethylmenaquinone methyltransferase/2-methoxy-6-polyprenyl-1,4-benzoquinol methylase